MAGLQLTMLIDVADLREPTEVIICLMFIARILCACRKVVGGLAWQYKLINLTVADSHFNTVLKEASCSIKGLTKQ